MSIEMINMLSQQMTGWFHKKGDPSRFLRKLTALYNFDILSLTCLDVYLLLMVFNKDAYSLILVDENTINYPSMHFTHIHNFNYSSYFPNTVNLNLFNEFVNLIDIKSPHEHTIQNVTFIYYTLWLPSTVATHISCVTQPPSKTTSVCQLAK